MTDIAELIEAKKYQRRLEHSAVIDSLSEKTQNDVIDAIEKIQDEYQDCYGMEPWEALDRATDYVFDTLVLFFVKLPASGQEEVTG